MINNLEILLTLENIYLFANWGVVPFWLLLVFMPNHNFTKIFVHSILPSLLLAGAYCFMAYNIYQEGSIFLGFELYLGLENLYTVFSNESFLLIFWLHFLSISIFVGSWIVRDAQKYFVPRVFVVVSLIVTYFSGPVGIVLYWFLRIFFAKKINFNE
jgi:hypothetical protein